ncbi:MAG: hypothetical protein O7A09_03765 [Proteobacteria bacterium]|nr:hypothetical protein [Pseudomonadota bacterium]
MGLALAAALAAQGAAAHTSSFDLYKAGEIGPAREAYRRELFDLQQAGDPVAIWSQLMLIGWLEESLGEPKRGLDSSSHALALALEYNDAFMIGRSLCFVGWSFASLGLYELALDFFDRAIRVGTPDGRIAHVAVWGLATQEKGWVLARMGKLRLARALLEQTTDFARRNGIDTGVAEGAAHLAEIARLQGRLDDAEALAGEAVDAALRCDCRDANTARAKVVAAKVALARARYDPSLAETARERGAEAVAFAEEVSDRRNLAEAKLVLSRSLPKRELDERLALVEAAAAALSDTESELRGEAEGELGRVLADAEQGALARLYLERGLRISESLFRVVDSAFLATDLAELEFADGETAAEIARRLEAVATAEASGLHPLALDNQDALSEVLLEEGYALHAEGWTERALATVETLLESAQGSAQKGALLHRKLVLSERLAEIRLRLVIPGPPAPVS